MANKTIPFLSMSTAILSRKSCVVWRFGRGLYPALERHKLIVWFMIIDQNPDVIVKWRDGTQNCVSIKELKSVIKGDNINRLGTQVKMYFKKRWYFGTVIMTDHNSQETPEKIENSNTEFSSDDELLLNVVKRQNRILLDVEDDPFSNFDIEEPNDPDFVLPSIRPRTNSISSDATICIEGMNMCQDVEITLSQLAIQSTLPQSSTILETESNDRREQSCEVIGCTGVVFSTCVRCLILQCWDHFLNDVSCKDHGRHQLQSPSILVVNDYDESSHKMVPESFEIEGASKEVTSEKKKRFDKKKLNKLMKDLGKEYMTQVEKKTVPERKLGSLCNIEQCKKQNRECHKFTEESRQNIFDNFWVQGNLYSQREFVARHVEKMTTKRKTVGSESRRQRTFKYFLTLGGVQLNVCRYFFLHTLSISERTLRTAVKKLTDIGIVEKDKRGGRPQKRQEIDEIARNLVEKHIERFPKVESHYCRESSSREYLHSDLTIKKMYDMFLKDLEDISVKPSFSTYRRVFKSKKLSFHRPKKDQCSLCLTYRESKENIKSELLEKYGKHQEEKKLFRDKRAECKEESKRNPLTVQCATFDLQQVINLPISNESAVFYKRRLSAYNFTVYDMTTGNCYCFTWHEGQSKRGSSEISTALYMFLKRSDDRGLKRIYLFADGCSGQNRNSIVASTLMYVINNNSTKYIEEIILRFSVPSHGQSEGDSAHSAISYAIKKCGDIHVPSQLIPIFKLARRNKPYHVIALGYSDFLNFKKLSTDLRFLSMREDDNGLKVNWTEMTEFAVFKTKPTTLFFRTSHAEKTYRSLTLKNQVSSALQSEINPLNKTCPKISKEKYEDLISLTTGDTPIIRLDEHVDFYKLLPH